MSQSLAKIEAITPVTSVQAVTPRVPPVQLHQNHLNEIQQACACVGEVDMLQVSRAQSSTLSRAGVLRTSETLIQPVAEFEVAERVVEVPRVEVQQRVMEVPQVIVEERIFEVPETQLIE
eukprot:2356541-Amphidinium_carterae.1